MYLCQTDRDRQIHLCQTVRDRQIHLCKTDKRTISKFGEETKQLADWCQTDIAIVNIEYHGIKVIYVSLKTVQFIRNKMDSVY